jgi:PhzF family phenazine biosynthesis protein
MATHFIYQVDAFTEKLFSGNPAAVMPLQQWLPDHLMQSIATENNLSETVFFVPTANGYHIRWFTPTVEIELCGHATLAAAYVLFEILCESRNTIAFQSLSGLLTVTRNKDLITLNFPANEPKPINHLEELNNALGKAPMELFKNQDDYVAVYGSEEDVAGLSPDFSALKKISSHGVIATAAGIETDFVSRCFYPAVGVDEDPVTGSAHTRLTPLWANKLKKSKLTARQISKRGGDILCELAGDRVLMSGKARLYMQGEIYF